MVKLMINLSISLPVQISTTPGKIAISGGGLPGSYIFDQMHFHWASEHLINNGR